MAEASRLREKQADRQKNNETTKAVSVIDALGNFYDLFICHSIQIHLLFRDFYAPTSTSRYGRSHT
jgi:hypothetical protein